MNFFRIVFCFMTLTSLSNVVSAGSVSGGGIDWRFLEHHQVWFAAKDKTINICYESVPEFGIEDQGLVASIKFALDSWTEYVKAKKIPESYAGQAYLTLQYNVLAKCDGSEDLTFYFGSENQKIEEARRRFVKPVAFSHLSEYNEALAWGKGFVWLTLPGSQETDFPDWKLSAQLQGALLHEVGHIFGCDHVEDTIMSDKLLVYMKLAREHWGARYMLQRIDSIRELVLQHGAFVYSGSLAHDGSQNGYESYQWLTDKLLIAPVSAKLSRNNSNLWLLSVSDAEGSYDFTLNVNSDNLLFPGNALAFNVLDDAETSAGDAQVFTGSIQGKRGESRQILVTRNARNGEGSTSIHVLQGGKKTILFNASRY